MTLNDLELNELALISYIDTNSKNIHFLHPVMRLGVVPGLEIEKLSSVNTCSEYRVEGTRVVISKQAGDYIIVVRV